MTTSRLSLVIALFGLIYNAQIYHYLVENSATIDLIVSFYFLTFLLLVILCQFVFIKKIDKILISLFLLINAAATFYISEFHIMLDQDMVTNILQTDVTEASELLSFKFFVCMLLWGFLPSILIFRTQIHYQPLFIEIKNRFKIVCLCSLLILSSFLIMNKSFAPFLRAHREVKNLIVPINYLNALTKVIRLESSRPAQLEIISADSKLKEEWQHIKKKTLMVVIIGETARAKNFSLNGYQKNTNPMLSEVDGLINWENVSSCGTSTAVSLPCLFSGFSRKDFDKKIYRENLLDLLKKNGFDVIWRDNNSGCKGVCERVTYEDKTQLSATSNCPGGTCYDEVLLSRFEKIVNRSSEKIVLVLHPLGSHGPAYHLRYPEKFRNFQPECQTTELTHCTSQEITNSYDNTILYTDYLLGSLIQKLKALKEYNTAMFYVSDHGESLGENHLYLHGFPYILAPREQTHVPMLFWASNNFKSEFHLDTSCLAKTEKSKLSHDNFFHSMLGLLKIDSSTYDQSLDLFNGCTTTKEISHR